MRDRFVLLGTLVQCGDVIGPPNQGSRYCIFAMDVPRRSGDKVDSFRILAAGDLADHVRRDLAEGDRIRVDGFCTSVKLTNAIGRKYRTTSLKAWSVELADSANLAFVIGPVKRIKRLEDYPSGAACLKFIVETRYHPNKGDKTRKAGEVELMIFGAWARQWAGRMEQGDWVAATGTLQGDELPNGGLRAWWNVESIEVLRGGPGRVRWLDPESVDITEEEVETDDVASDR